MSKSELRARFQSLRQGLSQEQVTAASAHTCGWLSEWPVLEEAEVVLTYLSFRNELDLSPLFALLPEIQWAVPRVEGTHLVLHPYRSGHLVRHRFGMLEPAAGLPIIDPTALDVVLVPGVAFDRQGGRLGFGGGYYDRFLPPTRALRVGVNYDRCLAEVLPREKHDQRMDWVVTPTQAIHCAPLWRAIDD